MYVQSTKLSKDQHLSTFMTFRVRGLSFLPQTTPLQHTSYHISSCLDFDNLGYEILIILCYICFTNSMRTGVFVTSYKIIYLFSSYTR